MRKGAARNQVQKRALRVLKQKKMYENQRDNLMQQSFNLDQTKFAQETAKDTHHMVAAMKQANTELKTQFKTLDIDEIEDMQDDMEDIMEMNNDIQEALGRQFDVPDELDEDDLLDELEALDDELEMEEESSSLPAYVSAAVTPAEPAEQEAEPAMEDEYGLPAQQVNI
jgi:charged multivesicular body protein 5